MDQHFDQQAWAQELKDLQVNISNFRFFNQEMLDTLRCSIKTMENLAKMIKQREGV